MSTEQHRERKGSKGQKRGEWEIKERNGTKKKNKLSLKILMIANIY